LNTLRRFSSAMNPGMRISQKFDCRSLAKRLRGCSETTDVKY
jgi:hypothetical protein